MEDLVKEIENLKKRVEELERKPQKLPTVKELRAKFDDIVKEACQAMMITEEEFFSERQDRPVSTTRHLVSYIAVNHLAMQCKDVGRRIRRDKTTVSHSNETYKGYLDMRLKKETDCYNRVMSVLINQAK
jgi:chromosomal replication initiation ATPase DnaA